MWRMSEGGVGVLTNAQAKLVKLAVAEYTGRLDGAGEWDDGDDWVRVEQVARMGRQQMLHALATVARALLDPRAQQPPVTADSEATAYQIFMLLGAAVGAEIGMFDEMKAADSARRPPRVLTRARRAISDALREAGCCKRSDDESDERCGRCSWCAPDPECVDQDEWDGALEALADRVLWDRDWEMEDLLADAEPGVADSVKGAVAIDDGYFSTPTPEPTDADVTAARAYLESVCAEVLLDERREAR
jgi:hypothetical protein